MVWGNGSYAAKEKQSRGHSRFAAAVACGAVLLVPLLIAIRAEALVAARLDDPPRYAAVVVMLVGEGKLCSATKIGTYRFLTAAHCVADTSTGAVASAFAVGRPIQVSNAVAPARRDFLLLHLERADLHPDFKLALEHFYEYKEKLITGYRERYKGVDLELRIRKIESDNRFTSSHPDLAVVTVRERTPGIPNAEIDFEPLTAEDQVNLVGYGCEAGQDVAPVSKYGRRRWGETRVIRIDPVNFYTFAHQMRTGAPSLCPGDSGGPVMREGKVVGVHGTVYGLSDKLGARSNMSVNLTDYKDWPLLR